MVLIKDAHGNDWTVGKHGGKTEAARKAVHANGRGGGIKRTKKTKPPSWEGESVQIL